MDSFLRGGMVGTEGGGAAAASTGSKRPTVEKPWVEKYRPNNMDEVVYQEEVVAVLRNVLEGGDMPHLLLYGPPGTGKTSTILALSRQLFGLLMKDRVLELNASDERGISVIRDKVKSFAQYSSVAKAKGFPCPPYKIIIMDEADSMTEAAQSALRRTMEAYSKVTRFCLICNYVSRIIDPIASRCSKFRFKPLSPESKITRMREIRDKEGVNISDEALKRLIELAGGDLRQSITFMQSAHRLRQDAVIETGDVEDIAGIVPPSDIERLLASCRGGYKEMEQNVSDLMASGFSAVQILEQIHDWLVSPAAGDLSDIGRSHVAERLAQADLALIDGANEYLQILDVCGQIMNSFKKHKK